MQRRSSPFRLLRRHPVLRVMLVGVFGVFVMLLSIKHADVLSLNYSTQLSVFHGSAESLALPGEADVNVRFGYADAAAPQGEEATLLRFSLTSRKAARVTHLAFSLDKMADDNDLLGLQLYIDGEFFAERPFFEGKSTFEDVRLRLHPGVPVDLKVVGRIRESAAPGHRLRLGFAEADDLMVQSIVSEPLRVDMLFPAWGPPVSVIGSKF